MYQKEISYANSHYPASLILDVSELLLCFDT